MTSVGRLARCSRGDRADDTLAGGPLQDVVGGAQADGLHRRVDGGVGGDDHHVEIWILGEQGGEQLEAAPGPDGQPLGTRVLRPQDVYTEVRGVAPDLIVYFGDLAWRSVGAVGNPSLLQQREARGRSGVLRQELRRVHVHAGEALRHVGLQIEALLEACGALAQVPLAKSELRHLRFQPVRWWNS